MRISEINNNYIIDERNKYKIKFAPNPVFEDSVITEDSFCYKPVGYLASECYFIKAVRNDFYHDNVSYEVVFPSKTFGNVPQFNSSGVCINSILVPFVSDDYETVLKMSKEMTNSLSSDSELASIVLDEIDKCYDSIESKKIDKKIYIRK